MIRLRLLRGETALIDDIDEHLAAHTWRLHPRGYVARSEGRATIYLHREILGLQPGDGLEGDHRNGDKLDNRQQNLRIVLHAGNMQNTTARAGARSRYRGVSWHKGAGRWQATVRLNGRKLHLGLFDDELAAARAAAAWRRAHMPFSEERER